MEKLKVYLGVDQDSVTYEVLKVTSNTIKFVDCSTLDFKDFKKLHLNSLITDNHRLCFYEIKYSQELLLDLLDIIERDVIWCFSSLPKNRKLYKALNKICNIQSVVDVSKQKDKSKFVKELCKEYKIPLKYSELINLKTSNSKFNINNEINKFSTALKVDPTNAPKILVNYSSDSDLFNLCINLIADKQKAIFYFFKVKESKVDVNYIYSMVKKRLLYYIYLALGEDDEAKKHWSGNAYFLNKDKKLASEYGLENLLSLLRDTTNLTSSIFGDNSTSYLYFSEFISRI